MAVRFVPMTGEAEEKQTNFPGAFDRCCTVQLPLSYRELFFISASRSQRSDLM